MDVTPLLDAVRDARPDGHSVRDWSIYASESRQSSLGVKDGHAGSVHAPLTLGESAAARYLFVWDDGRVSRGSFERRQVEHDAAAALCDARAAAYDDADAAQVHGPAEFPELELHDASTARMAAGATEQLASRLDEVRHRVAELRTWSGSFSASEAQGRLLTSAGLEVEGRGTSTGWHVSVDGEVGSGFGARRPEADVEFIARLERLVATARQLRVEAPAASGSVQTVLLHPRVVEGWVLESLLHNLDGSTVAHGEGRFRRDQFGDPDPVLREDLTLRIDPLEPWRRGSYRFTAEGVPASRCTYIENGRLVTPVLDLKYARRLGLPPTPVPYESDTLHLEVAERLELPEALETAGRGALVLSVLGVHTLDEASGDFSLSAPQTLRLADGVPQGRLRATLSGNLFDLLRDERLRTVRFAGETTPGLLVHCRLDPH